MSDPHSGAGGEGRELQIAVEVAIRLGALFLLVAACAWILAPFVSIVAWALIVAIAAEDLYERAVRALGGRRKLAAALLVGSALVALMLPAVLLADTAVAGARHFAGDIADGSLTVRPPPDRVADWPVIGPRVYEGWTLASQNLSAALERFAPQLKQLSTLLLRAAGSAGVALLQLAASLVLAGFLMSRREGRLVSTERLATRLAGPRGPEFARLANATVKSVVQGIVGVAVIQTFLAWLGFGLAGVPFAGLWALLVLVAAVVQLPVALVMVPPVLIVLAESGSGTVLLFGLWCAFVALLDNVLKPILFGRGAKVPTLVIFLGAIGGMLAMGLIGLFLGAVLLALGYELLRAWLGDLELPVPEDPPASPS